MVIVQSLLMFPAPLGAEYLALIGAKSVTKLLYYKHSAPTGARQCGRDFAARCAERPAFPHSYASLCEAQPHEPYLSFT